MAAVSPAELDALAATDVQTVIPAETLAPVLSAPPFIPIRSLINARDLGAVPGSAVPPGRIYRCGVLGLAGRDPQAVAWLAAHVSRVFDLRRAAEREASPDPVIPGVENVWLDMEGVYLEPEVTDFVADGGVVAWRAQLLSVVEVYKPIFREVLRHVRDRPTEPFLFHCTAGRDRTGVMGGMLQYLAGTSPTDTVRDYMLSRIGTEPARDKLLQFFMASFGNLDFESPGVHDMFSLRPAFWDAFMDGLAERYGGWEGYITKALGFSEEDLSTIRRNLRS